MKYKLEFYDRLARRWRKSCGDNPKQTLAHLREFLRDAILCGYRIVRISDGKRRVILYGGNKRALEDAGVR